MVRHLVSASKSELGVANEVRFLINKASWREVNLWACINLLPIIKLPFYQAAEYDIICKVQSGFRRVHDTSLKVLGLVEDVKDGFNRWRIPRRLRSRIMASYRRRGYIFLELRWFNLQEEQSTVKDASATVPQDSLPILNIYSSFIPIIPYSVLRQLHLHPRQTHESRDFYLQESLDEMEDWTWEISTYPVASTVTLFVINDRSKRSS